MKKLINADCMKILRGLPDQSFNLAIVDPPYFKGPNSRRYYGSSVSTQKVKRREYAIIDNWDVPGIEFWNELKRVSKNQIIWGINYFEFAGQARGGRIVWDKCNGKSSFSDCEIAYCSMHDSVRLFKYMWNGMMQGLSATEGHIMQGNKRLNEIRIHPTQKPIALYKWLLQNYAKPGDTILDTHLGSGSIAIVCHDMGYELTGIELDEHYYTLALDRLNQHKAQGSLNFE